MMHHPTPEADEAAGCDCRICELCASILAALAAGPDMDGAAR